MLAQDCQEKHQVLKGLVLRLVRRSAALSRRDRVNYARHHENGAQMTRLAGRLRLAPELC
jgi:hypothetical protein